MPDNEIRSALIVTHILETLGVDYIIGGSLASTSYGQIRATLDADIVADLSLNKVTPFINALGEQFYADETTIRNAIINRTSFNLIHLTTFFKVDVFISKQRPFDKQQLDRGLERILVEPDGKAKIASAEDTILAKLEWYRLGNEVSERQWRDIQGVLTIQGQNLDFGYLKQWAITLKVDDLLDKALKEANKNS